MDAVMKETSIEEENLRFGERKWGEGKRIIVGSR